MKTSIEKNRTWSTIIRICLLLIVALAVVSATARRYTHPFSVTAYCDRGTTSSGTQTRHGICAGPKKYIGRYIRIGNKRFRVEDLCRRGFDIWMPSRHACRQFGRHRLGVTFGASFHKPPKPAHKLPKPTNKKQKPTDKKPTHNKTKSVHKPSKLAHKQPKPANKKPKSALKQSKPAHKQQKPANKKPKPTHKQPKPTNNKSKPVHKQPKPAHKPHAKKK